MIVSLASSPHVQPHSPETGPHTSAILGSSQVWIQMLEIFERWGHRFLLHLHQGCLHGAIWLLWLMSVVDGHKTDYHGVITILLFKAIARGGMKKWTHEERLRDLLIQLQHLRGAQRLQRAEENYSAMVKTFREAERLQGNFQGRMGFL